MYSDEKKKKKKFETVVNKEVTSSCIWHKTTLGFVSVWLFSVDGDWNPVNKVGLQNLEKRDVSYETSQDFVAWRHDHALR